MKIILTSNDYKMNVYSSKGLGFYPILFTASLLTSISISLRNDICILFTILILGIMTLPISIHRVLKSINDIKNITMDITSLSVIEGEQICIIINFEHKLFELLKVRKLTITSDRGIEVSKTYFRKNKELFSVEIFIQGYCGKHQVRGLVIFFSDPLLFINYQIEIILVKPLLIRIVPKQAYIELNVERNIPYISYEAQFSRRKGIGVNILEIREYFPGDDYRRIDWKATARTSKLMVKEFEKHLYKDVLFIASIHDGFFIGDSPAIIYLLRIILNLLIKIVNAGVNLGIGIATESEIIVSNKITKYNLKHIYEVLSLVTWPLVIERKDYSSANRILRWFINELINKFCSESCLVILFIDIIDDLDVENIRKILKELMIRHYTSKIFLLQPTTIRFILSSIELNEFSDLQSEAVTYSHIMKYLKGVNNISSIIDLL